MNILDYIKGNKKGRNARKLEFEAMRDPFLADAIEGFDAVKGNHTENIERLQSKVMARSNSKKQSVWIKFAVAAMAVLATLGGYFALMNHESAMMYAYEQNTDLTIYVPEEYIEMKRTQLTALNDEATNGKSAPVQATAIIEIVNLHDVIKPFEPLIAYVPEAEYSKQFKNQNYDHKLMAVAKKQEINILPDSVSETDDVPTDYLDYTQKVPATTVFAETQTKTDKKNSIESDKSANNVISGIVTDDNGEPLTGVTVNIKGTNYYAMTDIDGKYSIQTHNIKNPELIVSYIGMEKIEIPQPKDNESIAMKPDNRSLNEVVVIGYGSVKKSDITGSVYKVDENRLSSFYTNNNQKDKPSEALSGKIAGVQATTSNDSNQSVKIRGMSSIGTSTSASNIPQPIDGMATYETYLQNNIAKPSGSKCANVTGVVRLEFKVDKSGTPTNIKVLTSLCSELDKQAIKLLKNGPKWTQSNQKGSIDIEF